MAFTSVDQSVKPSHQHVLFPSWAPKAIFTTCRITAAVLVELKLRTGANLSAHKTASHERGSGKSRNCGVAIGLLSGCGVRH